MSTNTAQVEPLAAVSDRSEERTEPGGSALDRLRRRFPPRPLEQAWPATLLSMDEVVERVTAQPFIDNQVVDAAGRRRRGVRGVLAWLADQPGQSWQQRWAASGAEGLPGGGWKSLPIEWHRARSGRGLGGGELEPALRALICADVIRPGLVWMLPRVARRLDRVMALVRDPEGFAALHALMGADPALASEGPDAIMLIGKLLACKGGRVEQIAVGDLIELYEIQRTIGMAHLHVNSAYQLLRRCRFFPPDAPESFRALSTVAGQLDIPALVDRYQLRCRPVRDLIVEYLCERQPALDWVSLRHLAISLAREFWADLEHHHPGIDSLHLSPQVAAAWRERQRVKVRRVRAADGTVTEVSVPRLSDNGLLAVRAFYQDLAQWAVEEPARWGPWVAPCPVRDSDVERGKSERRRKARMDQRTRERLPLLPVLAQTAAAELKAAAALLTMASNTPPGERFPVDNGQEWQRAVTGTPNPVKVWAIDTAGRRVDLTQREHTAFWAWAAIEVLRRTGVRLEEMLELTHHAIVEYRLPSTGELVPLLQIAPSKADAERLILVDPELADVLSAIVQRVRGTHGTVPLVSTYDRWERLWNPPLPLLFQRRWGGEHRGICAVSIAKMLNTTLQAAGATDATGAPLRITPHDFRRIFITDLVMNGLPPHIAQVIAGHEDINTTLRYKAVYPHEAIEAHRAFIARRRATRPSAEYRTPTEEEWDAFLAHFEKRKVSLGLCGRAFSSPCIHEHACIRCSLLRPDPAQRARLEEIRDNLTARISEAEREGWLGEVEGLQVSLAGTAEKIAQIDASLGKRHAPIPLGMPAPVETS